MPISNTNNESNPKLWIGGLLHIQVKILNIRLEMKNAMVLYLARCYLLLTWCHLRLDYPYPWLNSLRHRMKSLESYGRWCKQWLYPFVSEVDNAASLWECKIYSSKCQNISRRHCKVMRGGSWTSPFCDPRQPSSDHNDDSLCHSKEPDIDIDLRTHNPLNNIYLQWKKKLLT